MPTPRCEIPRVVRTAPSRAPPRPVRRRTGPHGQRGEAGPTCSRGHRRPTRPRPDRGGDGSGSPGAGGGDGTATRRRGGATPDAQHHLDHSGIRGRRAARRDHDAAAEQLEAATEHLERTRRHTAADVDQYHQARARVDETATALHRHDMRQRLNHTVDHVAGPATTGRIARPVESLGWRRHRQRPATR